MSEWQWALLVGVSLAMLWLAPRARTAAVFYGGRQRDRSPGFALLLSSLVISWLFAKSITNAANLGLEYGLVGGVAYAGYYLSFGVAGVVLYQLRTRGGYGSIHDFISRKHGRSAIAIFSLLIAFRLFNEVWSNTMVIGSYFGAQGSAPYYASVLVFTALTLAYSLKGGMGSSILTDAVQAALFAVLLATVLSLMFAARDSVAPPPVSVATGAWTLAGGLDLFLVACVQALSYPFHDPVMTDRGFLSDARTSRRAFLWAVPAGVACILLFSLVGVFGRVLGVEGQAPVEVARYLGVPAMVVVNLIMVTSAASTLDSTFSSWAKLTVVDLRPGREASVRWGRWAMVALVVAGTIPVFFAPAILSATTVSGLMVVGLAPVFVLWRLDVTPWAFHAAVLGGLAVGIAYATAGVPPYLHVGDGAYAGLLGATLLGTALAFILFAGTRLLVRR